MSDPTHRVLLIGIDAYSGDAALSGCVNDVDAVEAFLLDRLKIPPTSITKLASPHPGAARPALSAAAAPSAPADLASIRAALRALGGDAVSPGDRVLIHYSGHGAQVVNEGDPIYREALVPADWKESGVLYDREINLLIQAISARTSDLTLIFDCCHSAGATRGPGDPPAMRDRLIEIRGGVPPLDPALAGAEPWKDRGVTALLDTADPSYVLASACQADEKASEMPLGAGTSHGALTYTLLELLGEQQSGNLAELRWAEIWPELRRRVAGRSRFQHPRLIGRPERRVFGGAFGPRDAGYTIHQVTSDFRIEYQIEAGSLTGLTEQAVLAVYGPTPDRFPPPGSDEDERVRLGTVEVTRATPTTAVAQAQSFAFELPQGARARLIKPGPADRLVVEVNPWDESLAGGLESMRDILRTVRPGAEPAELRVGTAPDGAFEIGDDIYGIPGGEPPLVRIPNGDWGALERVLFHCMYYNLTLRLARRCRDLPGALEVTLLDCGDAGALAAADPQNPDLTPIPPDPRGFSHLARERQPFCVRIRNRSSYRLYVTLLACRANGRVELLAEHIEPPPDSLQIVWNGEAHGTPFSWPVPPRRAAAVDRIVAVGTTVRGISLPFLKLEKTFDEEIAPGERDLKVAKTSQDLWTATLVTLKSERAG